MTGSFDLDLPPRVEIREVVLREGLQSESPVSPDAKLAILDALITSGLRRIEVTSFVSRNAVPALADAERLAAELSQWEGVDFSAFVVNSNGAKRALEAGVTQLDYALSATDSYGMSMAQAGTASALDTLHTVKGQARSSDARVDVLVAAAWDCPFEGRTPVSRTAEVVRQAQQAGAGRVYLADTIGTASPLRVVELIDAVRLAAPGIELGVHFHDHRGLGLANVLAAVQSGVHFVDAAVGGLGGGTDIFDPNAGANVATEELLYLLSESDIETGVDLDPLLQAARLVEAAVRHELPSSVYRVGGRPHPRPRRLEVLSSAG